MNIDEAGVANSIATFKRAVDGLSVALDDSASNGSECELARASFAMKSLETSFGKSERFALRERALHIFNRLEVLRGDIEDLSTQCIGVKAAIEKGQSNV